MNKNILTAVFLGLVCLATYSNSLHNDFMMDDHGLIVQDNRIHNWKYLYYQFIPDLTRHLQIENSSGNLYYRPMAHIAPMICYMFFRGDPFGYHVVNLLLFIFCCFSLYIFVLRLFKRFDLALLTSLLFAVHPLNGLFVNYITASVFGIQISAMIWSSLWFIKSLEQKKFFPWTILSLLTFLLALLCHETAFALPFYFFFFSYLHHKQSFRNSLINCLPYGGLLIVIFLLRLKFASLKTSIIDKIAVFNITFFEYTATFTKLVAWYLSKFVYVKGIVLIWITQIVREDLWLWNGLLIILLGWTVAYIFSKRKPLERRVGLSLIGIGFIPVTLACFFKPANGFMIEPHWLFFPSIGLFLFLASLFLSLKSRVRRPFYYVLLILIIFTLFQSSRSINRIWSNEKSYCYYWLQQTPSFNSIKFYLAAAHHKDMEYPIAKTFYLEALDDEFNDWQAYTNLGLIAYDEKNYDNALDYLNKAIEIFPYSSVVYNNLGLIYLLTEKKDLALSSFEQAIKLNHFHLEPRLNSIGIYLETQEYEKAIQLAKDNLDVDPTDWRTLKKLVELYFLDDQNANALKLSFEILRSHKDPRLLVIVGSTLASQNYLLESLDFFEKSLIIDPHYPDTYLEIGKVYANQNQFDQAISIWKEGLSFNPTDQRFEILILQAIEIQKNE